MTKVTVKRNDAFLELAKITKIPTAELAEKILETLEDLGFIARDIDDCGKTVEEILKSNEMAVREFTIDLFKSGKFSNDEVFAFLGALVIWGDDQNPCPQCGCELLVKDEGFEGLEWKDVICSNSANCDYAFSNEPDWDTMPGGHDHY